MSGLCFPAIEPKRRQIEMIQHDASENEAGSCSQYGLKFDLGASTSDAPPPPWEAQRPPGVEMSWYMPAALVDLLPNARLSACAHSFERPVGCSSRVFFGCIFLFSRFDFVWTPRPKHSRKRSNFDFLFHFQFLCLDMPIKAKTIFF